MVTYTEKERTLVEQTFNASLKKTSFIYPHHIRLSLLQPIYVHYIQGIYNTKELVNVNLKLQVLNT